MIIPLIYLFRNFSEIESGKYVICVILFHFCLFIYHNKFFRRFFIDKNYGSYLFADNNPLFVASVRDFRERNKFCFENDKRTFSVFVDHCFIFFYYFSIFPVNYITDLKSYFFHFFLQ